MRGSAPPAFLNAYTRIMNAQPCNVRRRLSRWTFYGPVQRPADTTYHRPQHVIRAARIFARSTA
jgi:hypothetical protein